MFKTYLRVKVIMLILDEFSTFMSDIWYNDHMKWHSYFKMLCTLDSEYILRFSVLSVVVIGTVL